MARDPLTVKHPGCLVLLGWPQALEKHRVISSEGNFHETALWGHPALAPPHFFPRRAASSPNQAPNNVDLRNVNKNRRKKPLEIWGKQGEEQPSGRHHLKKSSLLFAPCTRGNAMKLLPRSQIFGWHINAPVCQNGRVRVDSIPRQQELCVWKQIGRLDMMVEVLPEGAGHCASPCLGWWVG